MYFHHTLQYMLKPHINCANVLKVYTCELGRVYHMIHYEVYAYVACSTLTVLASMHKLHVARLT